LSAITKFYERAALIASQRISLTQIYAARILKLRDALSLEGHYGFLFVAAKLAITVM
jgi:hypothetical protein